MANENAAQAGSQPPAGNQSPASTGWEAEKARLESELKSRDDQIRGLSRYRSAMDQVVRESDGVVVFDPTSGQVKWNVAQQQPATPINSGANPWTGLVEDPAQVDGWLNSRLNQAGYLTRSQADELAKQYATQAYQAARGDYIVLRSVDKTVSDPKYKELGGYGQSDLAKRTERILTEKGWGRPIEGAKSWESWQYQSADSLQQAADLARLEAYEASQASQAASQQGQQNQAALGLSVGQPGGGTPPGPQSYEDLKAKGQAPTWDDLKDQFKRNTETLGVQLP